MEQQNILPVGQYCKSRCTDRFLPFPPAPWSHARTPEPGDSKGWVQCCNVGCGHPRLQPLTDTRAGTTKCKKYTRDGSIIVFHDSLKAEKNMKYALPRAIEWLQEEGYTFALIPE